MPPSPASAARTSPFTSTTELPHRLAALPLQFSERSPLISTLLSLTQTLHTMHHDISLSPLRDLDLRETLGSIQKTVSRIYEVQGYIEYLTAVSEGVLDVAPVKSRQALEWGRKVEELARRESERPRDRTGWKPEDHTAGIR